MSDNSSCVNYKEKLQTLQKKIDNQLRSGSGQYTDLNAAFNRITILQNEIDRINKLCT